MVIGAILSGAAFLLALPLRRGQNAGAGVAHI